ncbi:hypothetical protein JAAARDRAFT_341225 [Jaapia argillacea MUCL 33604]|uniref:Uncharacterized protein n=1 Tax=Jaapia argillacea MUCL 33604 TaxID=933084 RepID=A0A067PV03_9AGAM|nr:hypothetical protein JAAARDRAFT_341225 [Jaapia argillacea MUCL 33604]
MSHYTSSSRRSSTESRLSIPHFPSARNFKISPGKFISRTFTKWLKSPEARSDGVDRLTILSVAWGKSNKVPSHEYLVVTLRNCSSSLRVERDSDSRSTLWSPKSRSSSKDTITIADHFLDLVGRDDTILASFAFKHPTVPLISLSTLLELISQQSDKYTLWTFNCWWYVGCLWRNLAKRAKGSDGVCFRMNEEVDEVRRFADEGGEAWDAIGFGQVLQFVHLAALERTWYRDSKAPKSQLKKVSDDIDQMFSQSCGRMEKGKVFGRDKLRVLILSQSEPSKSAFLPDAFRDAVVVRNPVVS